MDKNEIIQGYYINEAKIVKIITRNQKKKFNNKKLPIANISTTLPVVSEKIYSCYFLRIRFIRDENDLEDYIVQIFLFLLYFCIYYFLILFIK